MKPSSPQLDERRREPVEVALDLALSDLRRIARQTGTPSEIAARALARIEALRPEKARRR